MNEGPYRPDQPPGEQPPREQPPYRPQDAGPVPAPPPPPVPVGGTEPLTPPPPPPRRKRGKLLAAAVAAVVVIAGVAFAAVIIFHKVAGTSDVLAKMVPAQADVYVTAYLDPSASQKLHLRSLANKFPAAGGGGGSLSSTLDQTLEQALSQTGLSYIGDVKPWLGTQLAVAAQLRGGAPQAAVLITSKDDARAQATLDKARDQLLGNAGLTWSRETHGGVTVNVGSDSSGAPQAAYAVVDHTVVLSNAPSLLDSVIDTAQGHGSNLGDDDAYQATLTGLPDDVLGLAFVSPALVSQIPQLATGLPFAGVPPSVAPLAPGTGPNPFAQASAFQGLGASLSAQSNGLALDVTVALDSSKLPGSAKDVLGSGAHENTVLGFVPRDAYGLFALTGFQQLAQGALDQLAAADPNVKQITDQIGLDDKVLGDLTGDIGIEVGPGTGQTPSGALLLGTKNESGTQQFLDRLAAFASEQQSSGQPVTFQSVTYKGVTIKVATGPGAEEPGIQPAYAVTGGMGIVGTTPDAVKAVIDAHSGANITGSSNFSDTFSQLEHSNNALLYADIEAILSKVVPPGEIPSEVQSNLSRLKAAALDVTASSDRISTRLFFLIK